MEHDTNRPTGSNEIVNKWNKFIRRSVGATMFLNMRSSVLQSTSNINFMNWHDNNPLRAAKAFANQKQYWQDFANIWNSPF